MRSSDEGKTWKPLTNGLPKNVHNCVLRDSVTSDDQRYPGIYFGTTGLTVHTIKSDPKKKGRLYLIAAGNGAYRSDDSGDTWETLRSGIMDSCTWTFKAEGEGKDRKTASQVKKEHLQGVHLCVHKIALSPSKKDTVYQQNHCGVYSTKSAGSEWNDISPTPETRHGFGITATS